MSKKQPSERDIIVVIGSVIASDYQPVRLRLIDIGYRPLVKRCSWDEIREEDVDKYIREQFDLVASIGESIEASYEQVEIEAVRRVVNDQFGCDPDEIIDVVVLADEWERWGDNSIFSQRNENFLPTRFRNLSRVSAIHKDPEYWVEYV